MKNKKGQSLIEIVFSIGIVILVLTGVAVLIVSTTNAKTKALERQKAVELSQKLIEDKVLEIKNSPLLFWEGSHNKETVDMGDYDYEVEYIECNKDSCKIVFTIYWQDHAQNLSVERVFSRIGI